MTSGAQRPCDVFVSYASRERTLAVTLAERLKTYGLKVWFDQWKLRPGQSWQQGLATGLEESSACAVLIGEGGIDGWHRRELEAALAKQDTTFPVIPVLLPGADKVVDEEPFLRLMTWVDFRAGLDDEDAFDRLVWGVTGLRPGTRRTPSPEARIRILAPRDGDLLDEDTVLIGTARPGSLLSVASQPMRRQTDDSKDGYAPTATTDASGMWHLRGSSLLTPDFSADRGTERYVTGPYRVRVTDSADGTASQPVTLFHKDLSGIDRAAYALGKAYSELSLTYEVRSAFLERTALRPGRVLAEEAVTGPPTDASMMADRIATSVAAALRGLIPRGELPIGITIDDGGAVRVDPPTAWATYYAFPVPADSRMFGFPPGHEPDALYALSMTQMAWRLEPVDGRLPKHPFAEGLRPMSEYLEIRHNGYRPQFVELTGRNPQQVQVVLVPALEKRIAVLDFAPLNLEIAFPGFSMLVTRDVIARIRKQPEIAPFGVFDIDDPGDEREESFFGRLGRPAPRILSEVLGPAEVAEVESRLRALDNATISGEGRFIERRSLDIQLMVRGSYTLH
jgi:hypothetical protein